MPSTQLAPAILARLRQLSLAVALAREAGWRHVGSLALCAGLSSVLVATSLGVGVAVLLGASADQPFRLPFQLTLPQGLALLAILTLLRGILQTQIAIRQEVLRSTFTDRLRHELLALVLMAPSGALERLGRGDMLGLLMADISRSVFALQQAIGLVQALLSLLAYAIGVLVVGRQAALPLLLAMLATAAAALLQRSQSWRLGRLQSRLMGSLQRTVGDGLHGLKAVRAAAAQDWVLQRFARDSRRWRQVMLQNVRRQSLYGALRDALVVLVVACWWIWSRGQLSATATVTTLLLAQRSAGAMGAVVAAQRSCLGVLPGYQELCAKRQALSRGSSAGLASAALPAARLQALEHPAAWGSLRWRSIGPAATHCFATPELELRRGSLLAVVGPSGSGKTTLLDRFCGWLADEQSQWQIHRPAGGPPLELAGAEGARQLRQLLAYAPQDAVLFEATLRHNLLLGRRPSSAPVEPWLERVGLAHLLQRPGGIDDPLPLALDQFSGGEIHRLGLVRAWLRDRPVEVFDEPTAFLDAESAQRVRAILKERSRERLVLISTHDPALIALAERVITLQSSDRKGAELQHHVPGLP
ncbi:MAG: ATP-binding cassette domain-containing protein [Cyanobium sp.]